MRMLSFPKFALAIVWLLAAGLALAAEPQPSGSTSPPHESGGIGDDDPLAAISGDYNLQIVFATQGSGEYLADIRVSIADANGSSLLDAQSPGPLFFVKLPGGTYRFSADFQGKRLTKTVAVTDRRRQSLYFYWPREDVEAQRGSH